jgi:glycosyltransferase involved in cell wall biosynthesis
VRVLVDTSFAARGPSGTAVYLERLVEALGAGGGVEVVEPPPRRRLRPGRAGRLRNPLRSAANLLLDLAWVQLTLPRAARRLGADILHHPLPAHAHGARCAQVITVHDVAFEWLPERFDRAWRALARRAHRRAARRADAVICVSESTAADAIELLGAPRERVVVAPHGPGQELDVRAKRAPSHFLYVGDAEPRKDLDALLGAYADYRDGPGDDSPLGLVLAGAAAAHARGEGVRGEPGPSGDRLAELMAGAAALVHPSLHEGFGLTLVEAMSAGVPVVAVRSAGAEEVCGEAALLVHADGLTEALDRVARDPDLRSALALRGRERSRAFSWEESAHRHEQAYRLAADSYRTGTER